MRVAAILGALLLGFVAAQTMREIRADDEAKPGAAVWVSDGVKTHVQLANVALPGCLPEMQGRVWSPPMFVLPWEDDHDGPLPWTGNRGTTHLAYAGFTSGGNQVLAHLHVLWNTTTGANGQVVADLTAGRIVVHFMVAPSDHTPLCSIEVPFVRQAISGDVNGDGAVDEQDMAEVEQHLGERY
jgi:hypothetical protein